VVFRTVLVSVRVLMIGVRRVLGMPVLVTVVLSNSARLVMPIAMLMSVRVLMSGVLDIVGMAMLVDGVLRVGLRHRKSSSLSRRAGGPSPSGHLSACATISAF
jgi:hypothetical protein